MTACCCLRLMLSSFRTRRHSRPWQERFVVFMLSTSLACLQYIFILLDILVTADLPPYKHSIRMLLCKSISTGATPNSTPRSGRARKRQLPHEEYWAFPSCGNQRWFWALAVVALVGLGVPEENIGKQSTNRRRNKRLSWSKKKVLSPKRLAFCFQNFSYHVMTVDYFSPHRHRRTRSYMYLQAREGEIFISPTFLHSVVSHELLGTNRFAICCFITFDT